ncbi:hypothetical protein ACFOZ5_07975 [Marinobacter lacisalsi]|uniref:Uncharacterized protein n=1 Tax=Marinobacter lacisalsi TaxID=475979 RepID=A0ABV8QF35_9GAMM
MNLIWAELNLEGLCLILESFRGLGAPEEMQESIRLRLSECRQAVDALKHLGTELAELAPPGSDMDSAMEELQRLTRRVSDYRVN